MRRFAVLVIALVLAPGLQSAIVQTRPEISISTLPGVIATPELRPLPVPESAVPELRPLPVPEVVPEVEAVVPEIISINPCEACFSYMTSLIEQLTEVAVPETEDPVLRPLPEGVEVEDPVLRPLPEIVLPENELPVQRPLPLPVAPELSPLPLPIEPEIAVSLPGVLPSEAEAEEELVIQARPLPQYIIRK